MPSSPRLEAGSLAALGALLGALSAGCGQNNGEGRVEAQLPSGECPEYRAPEEATTFSFEAGWLGTTRYYEVLTLQIFDHQVRLEETDGLSIRLQLDPLVAAGRLIRDGGADRIRRADPSQPLVIPAGGGPLQAEGVLSLFTSCPNSPGYLSAGGALVLTEIDLALDPGDTGISEHVAGTFTATMSHPFQEAPATVRAVFDFAPPRQPLAEFR